MIAIPNAHVRMFRFFFAFQASGDSSAIGYRRLLEAPPSSRYVEPVSASFFFLAGMHWPLTYFLPIFSWRCREGRKCISSLCGLLIRYIYILGFGFCCDSFSIWYVCILIRTYADLFFGGRVWGIRCVSVIVCIILCFYLFSSWGYFPLQSYWSLSFDHGLHCSDELMWEQQQQHMIFVLRYNLFRLLRPCLATKKTPSVTLSYQASINRKSVHYKRR